MLDGQWEDPFGVVGTPRQGVPDPHAPEPVTGWAAQHTATETVRMTRAGAPATTIVRLAPTDPLELEREAWFPS